MHLYAAFLGGPLAGDRMGGEGHEVVLVVAEGLSDAKAKAKWSGIGHGHVDALQRDGCCTTGPEDLGSHTICAVVTAEFLEHQRRIGNDLTTPMPRYRFPGLLPGDRWCVTAANWLRSHLDGAAAYVVLASTHERALEVVPLAALEEHAVDVPSGPGGLEG